MSTAPVLPTGDGPLLAKPDRSILLDEEMRRLAAEDDCVVNRLGAAKGTIGGILIGLALWAGCILAGIILLKR